MCRRSLIAREQQLPLPPLLHLPLLLSKRGGRYIRGGGVVLWASMRRQCGCAAHSVAGELTEKNRA